MGDAKVRTWPASVCSDPVQTNLWNVRGLDGYVTFRPGLATQCHAQQACDAINEHFDHGREA